MYAPTRYASLKLDATPSLHFSNLVCNSDVIAFAHGATAHVLPHAALADVSTRSASFKLQLGAAPAPAPAPAGSSTTPEPSAPDAITQLAVVALELGRLLVATTPTAFHVFACADFAERTLAAPRALFSRNLADFGAAVLGARRAEDHFLRGLAGCALANALLVGTSWGDVLAWRVEGAVLTMAQVLSGGHAAAIASIAVDDRFIVTGDDAGVVCQWSMGGGGARGAAPSALLARHDKGEGAPVTAIGILGGGGAAAVAYADGRLRVFLLGGAPLPGSGAAAAAAAPSAATAAASGRALELEVAAHLGAVMALAVHPRLPCFATVGQDGMLNVWSLPELARPSGGGGAAAAAAAAAGSAAPASAPAPLATVGRLVVDLSTKVSSVAMLTGLAFAPATGSPGQYHLLTGAYDCSSLRMYLSV